MFLNHFPLSNQLKDHRRLKVDAFPHSTVFQELVWDGGLKSRFIFSPLRSSFVFLVFKHSVKRSEEM